MVSRENESGGPDGIIKDLPDHANPPDPPPSVPNVPHGLEVLRTYGEGFAGREAELAALHQAWNGGAVRVFVLHAQGGAGKTRVVAKWLTQLRDAGWRGTGRVPLFQADIQLTRARLFRDRVALEEARRLIEKHGYHRRDGELADAMEAAKGWTP